MDTTRKISKFVSGTKKLMNLMRFPRPKTSTFQNGKSKMSSLSSIVACLRRSRLYAPAYLGLLPASSVISGIQLAITA